MLIDLTRATTPDGSPVIDLTDEAVDRSAAHREPGAPWARVSNVTLLLTVNVLNVVDAALTVLWIEMGVAIEGNPIVDAVGFWTKVVFVAAASWLVFRFRPRWLLVPIFVLAMVVSYHLLGALFVFVFAG